MTDTPTDTPVVTPLAVTPTRPVQDGILDPAWGQWVHDYVAVGPRHCRYTGPTDAAGYATIPASAFGLATITGGVASIAAQGDGAATNVLTECLPAAGGGALVVRVVILSLGPGGYASAGASLPSVNIDAAAWGTT